MRVLRFPDGRTGDVLGFDDDRLELEMAEPFPPGTRIEGASLDELSVRGKVLHIVRRRGATRFRVILKLVDLTRETREALRSLG